MIIDRVYLMNDHIVIVVKGRENHQPAFDLQNVPDVDRLIQMIKDKFADIDSEPHSPPPTDWGPFFNELKTALTGLDIGD